PDYHLAITPDGPRGPRRVMKEGVVFISSRSGRPLVPTGMAVSNAWWVPGSWTNLAIPKPFSRAILISGSPIEVPEDVPREQFAAWSNLLTDEMQRLEVLAARICAGDESAATCAARDPQIRLPGQSDDLSGDVVRSAA
ncbi:MAG: lysophospholipid acyltransferase family protein, partial [Planctomycetaceae bacterium]